MKKKVLHIGKYYHPFRGGIEKYNQDLVESPTYSNDVLTWILVHDELLNKNTRTELINGVKVTKVKRQGRLLFAPVCIGFFKEINRVIEDFKPDLIHIHTPNVSAFLCLISKSAKKLPWVLQWQSDVLGDRPDWRVKIAYIGYSILEKQLLNYSKKVIVASPNYLNHSRPLKYKHEICEVIPLGLKKLKAVTPSIAKSNTKLKLIIVGRLTYYKGHKYLIKALQYLDEVELKIIGKGELEYDLKLLVDNLKLNQKVEFLGEVSNAQLKGLIAKSDILCLPSIEKTEAFGMVILEAARLGKPALVSDVLGSGMSWVVQHKRTGLVVESSSTESIYEALKYIISNYGELKEWGINAQRRFEIKFNIDCIAKRTIDVYNEILKVR